MDNHRFERLYEQGRRAVRWASGSSRARVWELLVSADPSVVVGRDPGWFVVTDQGVVLSVRFAEYAQALAAWEAVVEGLRRELQRQGRPGWFIAERVRAVRVRYGILVGAWNGFQPLPRA